MLNSPTITRSTYHCVRRIGLESSCSQLVDCIHGASGINNTLQLVHNAFFLNTKTFSIIAEKYSLASRPDIMTAALQDVSLLCSMHRAAVLKDMRNGQCTCVVPLPLECAQPSVIWTKLLQLLGHACMCASLFFTEAASCQSCLTQSPQLPHSNTRLLQLFPILRIHCAIQCSKVCVCLSDAST